MTNAELIEKLQKLPPNFPIYLRKNPEGSKYDPCHIVYAGEEDVEGFDILTKGEALDFNLSFSPNCIVLRSIY